jgi:long-chain acyl-CoA synthetase
MRFSPRAYAEKTPDKPAYIMAASGEVVTYRQLEERANQCAHLFREAGLKVGDHIAIFLENNPRYIEIVWAAQRSGLYYTAVSRHLTDSEVEYMVNDCEAKVLLTSYALNEIVASLSDRIPNVHTKLMIGGTVPGYQPYEAAVGLCPVTPIDDELEGAPMLYSSGTTGRPKGIVNVELVDAFDADLEPDAYAYYELFTYNQDMVYLSPAPLYHAAPLYFCLAVHRFGGTVIIMERYDTAESLAIIEKHKVTHSQWVPTMFVRMLNLPDHERLSYDVSSMQMAMHGAAPIAVATKEQMIDWWGPVLFEYYGGTEGNGATLITSEEWLGHRGSVGRAVLGEVRILDDEGVELPAGETGSIYFSGGTSFEYHNDPEKTQETRTSEGWSTLGDIGCLDEDGYLYLKDRKADMIISGGVNIYPQEAEHVLTEHEAVEDVAVFGIPNDDFGEEVKAVIQPKRMAEAGPQLESELIAFCRSKISKIKCPVSIDFKEEFPRTPTGKLLKRKLKELYNN